MATFGHAVQNGSLTLEHPEAAGPSGAPGSEGPTDRGRGSEPSVLDVAGIGFGPANLGAAIALEEQRAGLPPQESLSAAFVEAQDQFGWHDGMLLPETDMQISFLKDLVSVRSPTSRYSFLSYLHDQGRLVDFINLKTFFPSRQEFRDYLQWAAERVSCPVHYGTVASSIRWNGDHYEITLGSRSGENGVSAGAETGVLRARNLILGLGIEETLPDGVRAGPRVFHNHHLLHHMRHLPSRNHRRFLVVGSGQSAAEVAKYLHENYTDAEVHASFRRFGYTPSDDTPYANRVFDPDAVDDFYRAPSEVKQGLLEYHWLTNYSAVDADLIECLYQHEYQERVAGQRRLFVHRVTETSSVAETETGARVVMTDRTSGEREEMAFDAVVFATGFRPRDIRTVLGPAVPADEAFSDGLPQVERDYSLRLPGNYGRIYLNGGVEHSHGLTSSLLSNVAVRSADIVDSLQRHTAGALTPTP
ncbi:lysine N(6)-hydroxylase/L-ornithine N(5)-oxygenase family protein [Nesterenkonia populi]